jgi:hypothetical protein
MNLQHTSFCSTQHLPQNILIQITIAAIVPRLCSLLPASCDECGQSFIPSFNSASSILPLTRIHNCTTSFNLKVNEELLVLQLLLRFLDIITLNFLFPLAVSTEFHLFCHIRFHIPRHSAYHGVHSVINFP